MAVSSAGGDQPRWRRDGKELFYIAPGGVLMGVPVKLVPAFEASQSTSLFQTNIVPFALNFYGGAANYDVTRDGSRFLINTVAVPAVSANLTAIVNWTPHSD